MTDTLLLGGLDLNAGAPYFLGQGYNLGVGVPNTVALSRLLVDGEVVSGDRTSNRTIELPITVLAASRALTVNAIEDLVAVVNTSTFTLTWTPTGGKTVVFDCFRGTVEQHWNMNQEKQGVAEVVLRFQALPFVRPPAPTTVGTAIGPTASTQVDAFDNLTGLSFNGTAATSTNRVEGTASVAETVTYTVNTAAQNYVVDANGTKLYPAYPYTFSFSRAVTLNLTGLTNVVSNWLGPATYYPAKNFRLRLVSAGGYSEWTGVGVQGSKVEVSWVQVTFDLLRTPAASSGTFSAAAVTSYILTATANAFYAAAAGSDTWQTDDLRAYPATAGTITGPSTALTLSGILGVARTPATITVSSNVAVRTLLLARCPMTRTGFTLKYKPSGTVATGVTAAYDGDIVGQADGLGSYVATYTATAGTLNGTYLVVTRVSMQGATSQALTATATIGGVSQTIRRTFTAGVDYTPGPNVFKLQVIGELTLPPAGVPAANYGAPVTITITSGSGIQHDEMYLLDRAGESFLVQIPASKTACTYFQIVPPAPDGFGSQVYAGNAADGSDWVSVSPYVVGQGAFNLNPGSATLLVVLDDPTVTSGSLAATFYPRYFAGLYS